MFPLVRRERNQRHDARALDRDLQLALVQRARSRDAARKDLSALGDELLECLRVLEIDILDLLDAELADALAAIEELLLGAPGSAGTAAATRSPLDAAMFVPPLLGARSAVTGAGAGAGAPGQRRQPAFRRRGLPQEPFRPRRTRSFFGFLSASLVARFCISSVRTIMWRMILSEFFIFRSSSDSSSAFASKTKRW
jgi:hypothetical protein